MERMNIGKAFWKARVDDINDEIAKGKIIEYPGGIFLTPHLSWAPHMPNLRIELLASSARQYWQS